MLPNILSIAVGLAVIALTLGDVFQSVVMPRATGRRLRISFYVWRTMWYLWPRLAWRLYSARRRTAGGVPGGLRAADADVHDRAMGRAVLIFGFGSLLWGMRGGVAPEHASFGTMLYFAGTSLLTIGFGDVVGRGAARRGSSRCSRHSRASRFCRS